jgi:hypothetical protein
MARPGPQRRLHLHPRPPGVRLAAPVQLRVPAGDYEGELSGSITVDELVTLHWDRDQAIDVAALTGVLDQPRDTAWRAWSGITLGRNESPCR